MSAITAKASRKMKKYAVLTREPRCFLGSFDFSWEQRKLGDMMNVTSVKRIHQSDWTDSGVRFLRARDIVAAAKNEEPDDYLYISKEKYEEYSALSGKVGVSDLLVTGVGTIGVPYLVRNLEPLYFKDGNIIWFQNSGKIDGKFLFYSFSAEQIQGFINESAGIGTVGTYTIESGKKTPISLPNQIEQARVGEFFQQLDNLITLHQRKCISFTGRAGRLISTVNKKRITSSWEQRKFGEITSKYEDPVPTPHDGYYRLGIRSHAKGTFHSYVAKGQELETAQMHRVAAGNFIVNITFGWEHAVAITDKNDAGKLVSHRFPQFSFAEGMVPEFFRYVIVDEKFRHHLWLASPGGAGRNRVLKLDEMLNYLMRFPSRDEQIKIAEFFRHLDNLITLHQRKLFLMKWRTSDANRNQTNRLVL